MVKYLGVKLDEPSTVKGKKKKTKGGDNNLLIVGGVVALLVVAVGVYMMMGSGGQTEGERRFYEDRARLLELKKQQPSN